MAVLVAIAIPVFTSQLEKSREATDIANIRSAYAEATAAYLADQENIKTDSDLYKALGSSGGTKVYFNAQTGKFDATGTTLQGTDSNSSDTGTEVVGGYTYVRKDPYTAKKVFAKLSSGEVVMDVE
ncbi:MAG: hypothetical protein K5853_06115 [Lachnospiraceae bacterium]|nr:hypothetical protein [Lachnospiraceae bacterium]